MIDRRLFLTGAASLAGVAALKPRLAWAAANPTHRLTAAPGEAALMGADGPKTAIWSFGDGSPGPLLRIPQGKPVHIRVDNALAEPTTVHWHGIRLDNAMDGVPGMTQTAIPVGGSFDYRFTAPDAGTYWYHSHERTYEQVARGLYGPLIVEEASPPKVDSDRLFLVDDWRLNDDGSIADGFGNFHDLAHGGRLGNWLTVNGQTEPTFDVRPGERIRLRCISAANARVMSYRFEGVSAHVIALDGQPLATPEPLTADLVFPPAGRADLIVDIPSDAAGVLAINEVSAGGPIKAAAFKVSGAPLRKEAEAVPVLPANPLPQADLSDSLKVPLLMQGGAMGGMRAGEIEYQGQMYDLRTLVREHGKVWAFNGVAGSMNMEALVRVPRGRTMVVDMVNETSWHHAMHLHGHHFQVLDESGKIPKDAPWRDTLLMAPSDKARIAFVADNPGKWLFHCHMLSHHLGGMGTWIEVA